MLKHENISSNLIVFDEKLATHRPFRRCLACGWRRISGRRIAAEGVSGFLVTGESWDERGAVTRAMARASAASANARLSPAGPAASSVIHPNSAMPAEPP